MFTLATKSSTLGPCCAPAQRSFIATLRETHAHWRSRRALMGLTAQQLEDVGITPEQAEREANRPFWDAPAHWRG